MQFISIVYPTIHQLKAFLEYAGNSLLSFRYYDKRSLDVIQNHICTYLLIDNDIPLAYGHLDSENGITWLGIAVTESKKGKGYGRMMMKKLLLTAKEKKIKEIRLSVDNNNTSAITLYEAFGFKLFEKKETLSFYHLLFD